MSVGGVEVALVEKDVQCDQYKELEEYWNGQSLIDLVNKTHAIVQAVRVQEQITVVD